MNLKNLKAYLFIVVLILASLACGKSSDSGSTTSVSEQPAPTTAPTEPPAPTNTPEPAVQLGDVYRSDDGGYEFAQVPGWNTEEFFGFASHSPADADEQLGPMILLIGGLNEEEMTLESAFADFTSEFAADTTQDMNMGEPFDTTVNGVPARGVDITGTNEDGTPMAGRVIIALVTSKQTMVAFGAATTELWDLEVANYYNAVVDSLAFFEPALDPSTFGGSDSGDSGEVSGGETEGVEVRQWASSALASSEYGSSDWAAYNAAGAPDLYPECADDGRAWASANSDGQDWLEVYFDTPVFPTEINIYETHSPDQVSSVDLIALDGSEYNVYSGSPYIADNCPLILTIPVGIDAEVYGVRISLNQSVLPWTEIDAVELVGISTSGVPAVTETEPTAEPVTFDPPAGFLWRLGGESGISDDQYSALGGMDVDSSGFLYMSDNIHGIWIYDTAGNLVQQIDHNEFNNPNDVAVSTQGGGYIVATSWGNNSVFVMDFNGNILTQFGSEGNGPGQFGGFSPDSVTIDLNNNIYVLDSNEDNAGEDWTRIQVFDINGTYLREWTIEDDFFSAAAIEYWAAPNPTDDRIFALGFIGGYIIEYDLQGNKIREIGEDVIGFTGPQDLAMDQAGNFYITIWTPDSVMKLDHDGNLVAQWGIQVEDGDNAWPEGGFYQTGGVAVSPDGSQVYANDWSGDYGYVTAFQFK